MRNRRLLPLVPFAALAAMCLVLSVFVTKPGLAQEKDGDDNSGADATRNISRVFEGGQKWAIIIGVNDYALIGDLDFAVADARLMARMLAEKAGYPAENVLLIDSEQPDAGQRPSRVVLNRWIEFWLKKAKPGDTVLVYFSGHGFERGEKHFLAPLDCDVSDLEGSCYAVAKLKSLLLACPAKQKVLVLDCCRNDPSKSVDMFGESSEALAAEFKNAAGLITLASCRRGQKSLEWKGKGQGLYTWFLAEGMGGAADYDRDGVVDSSELNRYLAAKVPAQARAAGTVQEPVEIRDDAVGLFALAKVTLPEGVGEVLPPGVTRAVFTVREETDAGALAEGAEIELFWRKTATSALTALGSATTDARGAATLDVELSLSQRAGGQFLASVSRDGRSLDAELKNFPANPNVKLYAPAQRGAKFKPGEVVANSIGAKLAYVPAGVLPASKDGDNSRPAKVVISQGLLVGVFEATQGEFEAVLGRNPSWFSAAGGGKEKISSLTAAEQRRLPVERVTWFDCVEFCNELSKMEGLAAYHTLANVERNADQSIKSAAVTIAGGNGYRLLTEAEWEYCCRAGTTTRYHFGDVNNGRDANVDGNRPDGTETTGPYLARTTPGGSYPANKFGLHDTHGNAWEWCWDWYAPYPDKDAADYSGPGGGTSRVMRGGSWFFFGWGARSADRGYYAPTDRYDSIGFRFARTP